MVASARKAHYIRVKYEKKLAAGTHYLGINSIMVDFGRYKHQQKSKQQINKNQNNKSE